MRQSMADRLLNEGENCASGSDWKETLGLVPDTGPTAARGGSCDRDSSERLTASRNCR
jgi:hypothetical protein